MGRLGLPDSETLQDLSVFEVVADVGVEEVTRDFALQIAFGDGGRGADLARLVGGGSEDALPPVVCLDGSDESVCEVAVVPSAGEKGWW